MTLQSEAVLVCVQLVSEVLVVLSVLSVFSVWLGSPPPPPPLLNHHRQRHLSLQAEEMSVRTALELLRQRWECASRAHRVHNSRHSLSAGNHDACCQCRFQQCILAVSCRCEGFGGFVGSNSFKNDRRTRLLIVRALASHNSFS